MNKVTLIGRLVKDPQLSVSPSTNKTMFNTTLAINRKYKDKNGNYPADFIPIRMFGHMAEVATKYLSKGDKIAVSGSLYTFSYTNKQGITSYSYYVIVEDFYFLEQHQKENNYVPEEENTQSSIFDNPLGIPMTDDGTLPF